jgi:hypothetical protein
MSFLAFMLVCWVAVRFLSMGRDRRETRRLRQRQEEALPAPSPLPAAETAEQKLRRQYVEGSLSVEQYERELDALYRSK